MTDAEFEAWIARTAADLSDDAARLFLKLQEDIVQVDDMLNPEEDELVMARLCSHVRAAGSREYYLEPEVNSRFSSGVLRLLEQRFPASPSQNGGA